MSLRVPENPIDEGKIQQIRLLRRNLPSTCMPLETLLSSNLLRHRSNDFLGDKGEITSTEDVRGATISHPKD